MKRITLLSVIAIAMLTVTACGSPAPATSQAPATQAVETQSPASQSQSSSAQSPTQPPASSSIGTEVDMTLADNTIDSTLTTFQAGVPYTFVIKNTGTHPHDFNINPPISLAGSLDAALSQALLVVPRQQLPPGATVTVTYTFPDSAVSVPLEFSCLIPRHYQDGMRLAITVTK